MCRVRNQHDMTILASMLMISFNHQHAGQFAVSTGSRLQRHSLEPRNFGEHLLQFPQQSKITLDILNVLKRVCSGKTSHSGSNFIDVMRLLTLPHAADLADMLVLPSDKGSVFC